MQTNIAIYGLGSSAATMPGMTAFFYVIESGLNDKWRLVAGFEHHFESRTRSPIALQSNLEINPLTWILFPELVLLIEKIIDLHISGDVFH